MDDDRRQEEKEIEKKQTSTFEALAMRAFGGGISGLTVEQVDEVLKQRGKTLDYIHVDRKAENSNKRIFFGGTLIFLIIAGGGVLWLQPDYLGELVSAVLGFGAGFGIAKSKI